VALTSAWFSPRALILIPSAFLYMAIAPSRSPFAFSMIAML
jgi:hypothetical protein